jgi:hypothetical protein
LLSRLTFAPRRQVSAAKYRPPSPGRQASIEETMTSPLQQKIKITGPVVVTANRVGDGTVMYRRADGNWTTELEKAAITTDPVRARELLDGALADALHAVDPYVAPVQLTRDGEVRPGNLRERIRRNGPTIDLPVALRKQSVAAST